MAATGVSWPSLLPVLVVLKAVFATLTILLSSRIVAVRSLDSLVHPETIRPYCPHYAYFAGIHSQPSPKHTMMVRDSRFTEEYEALLALGIPAGSESANRSAVVRVDGLDISKNDGQTWRPLDALDLHFLPEPCRKPKSFTPALATSPDKRQLVMFGFGAEPQCHQVLIYEPRRFHCILRTQHGDAGGGRDPAQDLRGPAHYLHAITTIPSEMTQGYTIVSFGGIRCDRPPCPLRKSSVHNDLWLLDVPATGICSPSTVAKWRLVEPENFDADLPIPRAFPSMFTLADARVLMVGGFRLPSEKGDTDNQLPRVLLDTWQLDITVGRWLRLRSSLHDAFGRETEQEVRNFLTDLQSLSYNAAYIADTETLVVAKIVRERVTAHDPDENFMVVGCKVGRASCGSCSTLRTKSRRSVLTSMQTLATSSSTAYLIHFGCEETLQLLFDFQGHAQSGTASSSSSSS
eukprot:scpid79417/ scgid24541/ 